ncbi:ATP-binding cassette domain-containing protein [Paracoccus sp. TOH]|uniref:ATP-binding cassette domain-containing protein n=1 Tax=Paracoccus sp. TOH TaxID=1263728 RepID=UPI0025AFB433|nr:ATP-binding cassette domain-containing protein [Paracoccus sp. TOH]WJS84768.1 ATP-binding cassette domain-containing protein [Paracoccus sp. TOH]
MRRVWRVMAAEGGMGRALALAALVLLAGWGLLALSGWFIAATAIAGLAGAGAVFDVFRPAASVRGLALLRTAARYGERMLGHDATLRAVAGLRGAVLAGLAAEPWSRLQKLRRGPALARVVADTDALDGLPLRLVLPGIAGLAVLALAAGLIGWLAGWQMAVWVCGAHLLAALAAGAWGLRRSSGLARAAAAAERDFSSHALDLVAARDDLAMHGRLPAQTALAMAAEARAAGLAGALDAAERDVALMLDLARIAAMAGSLGLGAAGIEAGLFGPAIAALSFFAAMALGEVVAPLCRAVADWGRIGDAADRVAPMLGRAMPAPAAAVPALPLQVGEVVLGPGQILGLCGPSGSGKSTLLAQIAGLVPPGDTAIALAGRPVSDWTEAALRAVLVMVPQRSALIAGTLRENLALAAPDADDDALHEILRAMRLDRLRGGLDLRLGDGGAGLSGGEARRLALARALLRKTPILLLDEPTEGLDEGTARQVMAEILQRSRDVALVIASHRPSDLKQAAFIRSFV